MRQGQGHSWDLDGQSDTKASDAYVSLKRSGAKASSSRLFSLEKEPGREGHRAQAHLPAVGGDVHVKQECR